MFASVPAMTVTSALCGILESWQSFIALARAVIASVCCASVASALSETACAALIASERASFVPSGYCPASVPSVMLSRSVFASWILAFRASPSAFVPFTVTVTDASCL